MSDLSKEFSNFYLFNGIKDQDNNKIKYCKNLFENKCINENCELFYGYNNILEYCTGALLKYY